MKAFTMRQHLNRIELLVLISFLLLNLRVLTWFQPGYLVFGGDLRPPVEPSVFLNNALNSWNQVDWGVPSVYSPRMLDPFLAFMTVFQLGGLTAYSAEMLATYLIYVFVSILMYAYLKNITKGDMLAAFIGTLFFVTNVHLIVDREQTAIGFVDMCLMILPSLVAFAEGLRRKSFTFMTASGFLFVLTYASFPNYRAPVLCFIAMLVTLGSMYIGRGSRIPGVIAEKARQWKLSFDWSVPRRYAKYIVVFVVALAFASVWLAALVYANLSSFLSAFGQAGTPLPATFGNRIPDVIRLIAEWSFYDSYMTLPYVPYAQNYFTNPLLVVLTYVPTILAFAAAFVSKSRRQTVFFAGLATLFLLLTMGSSPQFASFYSGFLDLIPIIRAFRTSTNWIFLVLLTFSVLLGFYASGTWRKIARKRLKIIAIAALVGTLCYTSYPLFTGDVTKNWMEDPQYQTVHNGGYVPPYFYELDSALPGQYWTLLMPQRSVYVIYNFTGQGVLAVGNPYPLVISKPFISTSGTEYVQSASLPLLKMAYGVALNGHGNAVPSGNVTASSVEDNATEYPGRAVDGDYGTRWASKEGMPQYIEIDWNQSQRLSSIGLRFQDAYAKVFIVQTWNGTYWNAQAEETNYTNPDDTYYWLKDFASPVDTTKLRIVFLEEGTEFHMVSLFEIEYNPSDYSSQLDFAPKFLGMLGIKTMLAEYNILAGWFQPIEAYETLNETNNQFVKDRTWEGAATYENPYAQPIVYAASNITVMSDVEQMRQTIRNSSWETLQESSFASATSSSLDWNDLGLLQMPQSLSWKMITLTKYEITAQADAPFVLAFLENFDSQWKAAVNGQQIPETNHFTVNFFGNGWVVDSAGNLQIVLEYKTQSFLANAVLTSAALCIFFAMVVVARKPLKMLGHSVLRRFKKVASS
jgi:hypothetical protein